ncbi:unnamed protein product [Microthlaspi erraticum]|uniref:Endonuclease/exonuclease/phosphatase domain-containing protein n=1 Tax=Microthlaspi erraticum TaxID=1685480 RepID=A0A6D2I270_9BRAS|nr:unnamed protein product [Microthlaspi erraticum]
MCRVHFPDILFLMETKNKLEVLAELHVALGYKWFRTIEPDGLSGGLAIFWKENLDVVVLLEDKNVLDMKITSGGRVWFLSCIYGNPNPKFRAEVWERVTRFGSSRKDAWCMIGDFNEILSNDMRRLVVK